MDRPAPWHVLPNVLLKPFSVPKAVTCQQRREGISVRGTCEDIGARAHGAADQHGLPCELVIDGDEGVVRGESARGT